jgi:hypothetical protein
MAYYPELEYGRRLGANVYELEKGELELALQELDSYSWKVLQIVFYEDIEVECDMPRKVEKVLIIIDQVK